MKEKKIFLPVYKLVVLGSYNVGKSSLIHQYIKSHYSSKYDPTIEDIYIKEVLIDNQLVQLEVLDTAGQFDNNNNFRIGDGFLLVFSIDDKDSFDKLNFYRKQILIAKDRDEFPMIVIANKFDLQADQKVLKNEIISFCQEMKISPKLQINVNLAFENLVRLIRLLERNTIVTKKNQKNVLLFN